MITSSSNSQIKLLSGLLHKPKERKNTGLFVVEGIRMFRETPADRLQKVYLSESFAKNSVGTWECDYEIVSDSVFRAVSDTQTPQGILAVVRMPFCEKKDVLRKQPGLLLLLEGIQDPGNLGTMIRTGEGAGVTGVIMDSSSADLYNPKTIRSTMGSIFRVPCYRTDNFQQTLSELKEEGVTLYAAHLKAKQLYDEPDYTRSCGFLIGNEGSGLTDASSNLADIRVRIPMEGRLESLNAAVSAALLLYECGRQRRKQS